MMKQSFQRKRSKEEIQAAKRQKVAHEEEMQQFQLQLQHLQDQNSNMQQQLDEGVKYKNLISHMVDQGFVSWQDDGLILNPNLESKL